MKSRFSVKVERPGHRNSKFFLVSALALVLGAAIPPARAETASCRALWQQIERRQVGVETIHRTEKLIVTVHLPLPRPGGRILDLGALDRPPDVFTISDGTLRSAFIRVDHRPGTPLARIVERLIMEVGERRRRSGREEAEILRVLIAEHLAEAPNDWRPGIAASSEAPFARAEFVAAKDLPAGHYPLETRLEHPVIALEEFLERGKGACLPKVLLTSLILHRLGIAHRITTGATEHDGHSWIELADGRILDPTWKILERPTREGALPGWFRFSGSFMYRNQFTPVAVD